MKSCFFIGHRETGEELYPSLMQAIRKHITEYGVTEFYVGKMAILPIPQLFIIHYSLISAPSRQRKPLWSG